MKKTTIVLSSLLLLSSCASLPPPLWLDTDQDMRYPAPSFISGSGCGKTRGEARQKARVEIARKLVSRVDSINETNSFLETNQKNGRLSFKDSRLSSSDDVDTSDVSLAGVFYPDTYRSSGRVCVLAVVNKNKARTILLGDFYDSKKMLNRYSKKMDQASSPIFKLRAALLVLKAEENVTRDKKTLALFGKRVDSQGMSLKKAKETVAKLGTFYIEHSYGSDVAAQGRLEEQILEDFTKAGFTEAFVKPAFIIKGEIEKHDSTYTPEYYGPLFHERWAARVTIYDGKTGRQLLTREEEGETRGKELSNNQILGYVSVYDKESNDFSRYIIKPLLREMLEGGSENE